MMIKAHFSDQSPILIMHACFHSRTLPNAVTRVNHTNVEDCVTKLRYAITKGLTGAIRIRHRSKCKHF